MIWSARKQNIATMTKIAAHYYCQTSNITHVLVGIKFVDLPDVVIASPIGAAETASSFST